MGYDAALRKAWGDLGKAGFSGTETVRFFSDEFRVDAGSRSVLTAGGQPAKDFVSILLLHYLEKKLSGLPPLTGRWISFKELEAGEQYYPAFRKRSIDLLLKKHGQSDARVDMEAFEGVPLQVIIWKGDEEFPADATILFDGNIGGIFCTEDIAVLAGFIPKYF
jgi:hypothetical protein